MGVINKQEKIQCGWCGEKATLEEWDNLTYSQCTNREMRRAYTSLTNEKAFLTKTDTYYECPNCHKWSRGNQLSFVDTEDPKLLRLGGKPTLSNNNQGNK